MTKRLTDRELLELAAKAYGAAKYPETGEWEYFFERDPSEPDGFKEWNPLTDDGDALRLAVKLGLWITIDTEDEMTVDAIKATSGPHGERPVHHVERFKYPQYGDASMAARRAIVRCAAEIGKGMK